jgi:hypothetical protein
MVKRPVVKRPVPAGLREKYEHLSYGGMVDVAELFQWQKGSRRDGLPVLIIICSSEETPDYSSSLIAPQFETQQSKASQQHHESFRFRDGGQQNSVLKVSMPRLRHDNALIVDIVRIDNIPAELGRSRIEGIVEVYYRLPIPQCRMLDSRTGISVKYAVADDLASLIDSVGFTAATSFGYGSQRTQIGDARFRPACGMPYPLGDHTFPYNDIGIVYIVRGIEVLMQRPQVLNSIPIPYDGAGSKGIEVSNGSHDFSRVIDGFRITVNPAARTATRLLPTTCPELLRALGASKNAPGGLGRGMTV